MFVYLPLYLWNLPRKYSNFTFFYLIVKFIRNVEKPSVLLENSSTSFSIKILIVFICLPLYMINFPKKLSFQYFPLSSILPKICYTNIYSSIRKCIHFLFKLNSTFCMPTIISLKFSKKIIKFYIFSFTCSLWSEIYKNLCLIIKCLRYNYRPTNTIRIKLKNELEIFLFKTKGFHLTIAW